MHEDRPQDAGGSLQERFDRYSPVSNALATMSDSAVIQMVWGASKRATGIGGTTGVVSVDGTAVFVKVIPLTDRERAAENLGSTANLFRLPPYCHYGIGSPGIGAWRELAAHVASTQWILDGQCASFPLTYHWRVLPLPAFLGTLPEELVDADRMVAFWENSAAMRARLAAVVTAPSSIVVFGEYIPRPLIPWLEAQVQAGPATADAALSMVDTGLRAAVAFFHARGWTHFDAHFGNVLTDGRTVYLADYGLAASTGFALEDDERAFLRATSTHDLCYVVREMVNWIARVIAGQGVRQARLDFVRGCADGRRAVGVRGVAAALLTRYAPIAVVMNEFYGALYSERRTVPYPAHVLDGLLRDLGIVS